MTAIKKKNFGFLWEGIKWIAITIGFWICVIIGGYFLIALAQSATVGFGIAVAGIAVGAGISIGIYFIFRNKEEKEMKKLLVLLMVLGLAIFWMPKSFADAPPDFNPPSGGPTIQEELQQVKELAAERIKEAKSLQIRQKAEKILKERGYYNNSWEGESWIFSDYSPGSKLLIERSKYRRGDETLTIEYNGELVFRFCYSNSIFTRGVIQVYRPGLFKWIAKLDEIFDGLDEVKAKGEIKDLKNRFGI